MEKKKTKKKLKYNAPSVLSVDSELHSYCADGSSASGSSSSAKSLSTPACGLGGSAGGGYTEFCGSGSNPTTDCNVGGSTGIGCVSGAGNSDSVSGIVYYSGGGDSCTNGDAPNSSDPGSSGCGTGNGVT